MDNKQFGVLTAEIDTDRIKEELKKQKNAKEFTEE